MWKYGLIIILILAGWCLLVYVLGKWSPLGRTFGLKDKHPEDGDMEGYAQLDDLKKRMNM